MKSTKLIIFLRTMHNSNKTLIITQMEYITAIIFFYHYPFKDFFSIMWLWDNELFKIYFHCHITKRLYSRWWYSPLWMSLKLYIVWGEEKWRTCSNWKNIKTWKNEQSNLLTSGWYCRRYKSYTGIMKLLANTAVSVL